MASSDTIVPPANTHKLQEDDLNLCSARRCRSVAPLPSSLVPITPVLARAASRRSSSDSRFPAPLSPPRQTRSLFFTSSARVGTFTAYKDENGLCTSKGKGSIGAEIVKGILSGGSFQHFDSKGRALTSAPSEQGSKRDVGALVDYAHSTIGLDLDYVFPFAAVPEDGHKIVDESPPPAVYGQEQGQPPVRHSTDTGDPPLIAQLRRIRERRLHSEFKISLETFFNRWNPET
ncbi:hypothetical protein CERSUDRAFT_100863 [Gelatoporia subvermispora B]|uniref:Uncharacterized protein n=1 Tax=Ceriporiopsis subvermispora (strain B) TaxID=914234 RepID=M2QYG5_CERS8|nr:hypothetical protein CERSUDRAFT_100863 [Gelatoporia subvermispora B]